MNAASPVGTRIKPILNFADGVDGLRAPGRRSLLVARGVALDVGEQQRHGRARDSRPADQQVTIAGAMRVRTARKGLFVLGTAVGVVYILVGVIVGALPAVWEDSSTGGRVFWIIFLVGAGVLVLAGLRVFERSPWAGAALVSVGAIVGGLVLAWSVAAPVAAIVLIVLSVVCARRAPVQMLA